MFKDSLQRFSSLKVAVLSGGNSEERAVSLKSGAAVAAALERLGHSVTNLDPVDVDLASFDWSTIDVAFLALHGRFGEDGTLQALLDRAGVPYTGSGAQASRLAFSKSASKERFLQCRVPTPPYVLIHASDDASRVGRLAQQIGFPLVIKPDRQGSSLGVSIVDTPDNLPEALSRCFALDDFGLVESAIVGGEWTVGLFDELVLPPILIETERQFYDYRAKYEDDATSYRFEFLLPPHVVDSIADVAVRAGQALGTCGLCRVDIRLDEQQSPWVLEVNTIPGMTDHSLVPKAAWRMGISFESLCRRAIESCLAPKADSAQLALAGHPAIRAPFGPFLANSRNSESVRRR